MTPYSSPPPHPHPVVFVLVVGAVQSAAQHTAGLSVDSGVHRSPNSHTRLPQVGMMPPGSTPVTPIQGSRVTDTCAPAWYLKKRHKDGKVHAHHKGGHMDDKPLCSSEAEWKKN